MEALVDSKYLAWFEIGDANAQKNVNIIRAEARDEFSPFTNKEKKTAILYTREYPKGMVINKTNYTTLCKLLGFDYTKWASKRITLVVKEEKIKGELINVLRISKTLPPQETQAEVQQRKSHTAKTSTAVWGEDEPPNFESMLKNSKDHTQLANAWGTIGLWREKGKVDDDKYSALAKLKDELKEKIA